MVAQIFPNIKHFEIRVSWHDKTTGYVNGNRFQVEDNNVTFPGHPTFNNPSVKNKTRDLALALAFAVRHTPEFSDAKRESKAVKLEVTNGNFPGLFQVHNPLNGSIYNVVLRDDKTFCECADHQYRGVECKHLKAVKAKQPQPKAVPVMSSYAGKAFSAGRLKSIKASDITDEQLAIGRASLGI